MGSTEHTSSVPNTSLQDKNLMSSKWVHIDRLDMVVIGVIVLSIMGIGIMTLIGSTVGIQIRNYSPETISGSQATISIEFDLPVDRESAEAHFNISPSIDGQLIWIGDRQMQYLPDFPLTPKQDYTVTLSAGVEDKDHRISLQDDFQFQFRVKMPSIVYVGFGENTPRNLFKLDLETMQTTQLTNIQNGIEDYDVSSDGEWIAYSSTVSGQLNDIWALNLENDRLIQVTNCAEAQGSCFDPDWRPDNRQIAYTRRDINVETGLAISEHVWLVDLATLETRLLFDDVTVQSRAPEWSPVGERIAVYFLNPQGIFIQDFQSGENLLIPTTQGIVGTFSPDGNRLIYPILVQGAIGEIYYTHLELAQFENLGIEEPEGSQISGGREAPVEDLVAAFHPDGQRVAVTRRYLDSNYTEGTQVYLVDLTTMEAEPLIVDPDYIHGFIRWSGDGSLLLMQRYQLNSNRNEIEIWMYELQTGELSQLLNNGFAPQFLSE